MSVEEIQAVVNNTEVSKTKRFVQLAKVGLTRSQIAKVMNVKFQQVYQATRNMDVATLDRGPSKASKMREMYVAGAKRNDIAKKFDCSFQQVYQATKSVKQAA